MNKIKLLLLVSLSLLMFQSFGQGQRKKNIKYAGFLFYDSYYFNGPLTFHLGGGLPLYSGDLCSGLGCNTINPGFLLGASYKFAPGTYAAIDYQNLKMGASDALATRAYAFSSTNHEFTAYVRYDFIKDIILKHYHMDQKPRFIKPFMKLGIGALLYNSTVAEAVVGFDTTGYANAASGIAIVIPVGLGVSFSFSNKVSLLVDANYRYCFSDNLDAYNNSVNNDGYLTANVTLTISPWAKRLKPKQRKAPEGTRVPSSGGSAAPSGGSTTPKATPKPSPGTEDGGTTDDQIVPENTDPAPAEEEIEMYEGYEEESTEEETSEEDEYLDFEEEGESEDSGTEQEYYNDSGW